MQYRWSFFDVVFELVRVERYEKEMKIFEIKQHAIEALKKTFSKMEIHEDVNNKNSSFHKELQNQQQPIDILSNSSQAQVNDSSSSLRKMNSSLKINSYSEQKDLTQFEQMSPSKKNEDSSSFPKNSKSKEMNFLKIDNSSIASKNNQPLDFDSINNDLLSTRQQMNLPSSNNHSLAIKQHELESND